MKRQVLVLVCVNGGPPVSLFFRWGVHEEGKESSGAYGGLRCSVPTYMRLRLPSA
jgi:hypothetical protein